MMDMKGIQRGNTGHAEEATLVSPLHRLYRLTDSVFAVVMVIMVVFIARPENGALTEEAVLRYLRSQVDTLVLILITFFAVSMYWFTHTRQARYLARTDPVHSWLTLLYLACVVILPFPNALITFAPNSKVIQMLFSATILLVGLMGLLSWVYASRHSRLLRADIDPTVVRSVTRELMIEPSLALISIPAALVHPKAWEISFGLIPVIMAALAIISRRQAAEEAIASDLDSEGLQ